MPLAIVIVLALGALGAGLIVTGVAMLAGPGWATIAAGCALLAAAAFLRRGI